jgi:hypothetical protein
LTGGFEAIAPGHPQVHENDIWNQVTGQGAGGGTPGAIRPADGIRGLGMADEDQRRMRKRPAREFACVTIRR